MDANATDGIKPLLPYVVATGFTTALLGDERTLREFIVGEHMRERVTNRGRTAVLILVNDSYDALTDRQLRIGVNKNEGLFQRFLPFCGRPIAEIPDPFDCHPSYSDHFADALRRRLHALDIHPILVDTYHAYRRGHYAPFVRTTFENHQGIQNALAAKFSDFSIRNLFRPQCPRCRCIDSTRLNAIEGGTIAFDCERCGTASSTDVAEVQGKLSWKLDCAARWNLYGIDLEVFSKVHVADRGTLGVSRFISREFFGGRVPVSVTYGEVILEREVSYRMLDVLPPALLRQLFLTDIRRDLRISKDYLENFCQKVNVIAGMSYVDYVRRELPTRALRTAGARRRSSAVPASSVELDDPSLIEHGLHFARYFYGRDHELDYPDVSAIASIDRETAVALRDLVRHAIALREGPSEAPGAAQRIRAYMLQKPHSRAAYEVLRRMFRQPKGPSVAGLLGSAPMDYLCLLASILALVASRTDSTSTHVTQDGGER